MSNAVNRQIRNILLTHLLQRILGGVESLVPNGVETELRLCLRRIFGLPLINYAHKVNWDLLAYCNRLTAVHVASLQLSAGPSTWSLFPVAKSLRESAAIGPLIACHFVSSCDLCGIWHRQALAECCAWKRQCLCCVLTGHTGWVRDNA